MRGAPLLHGNALKSLPRMIVVSLLKVLCDVNRTLQCLSNLTLTLTLTLVNTIDHWDIANGHLRLTFLHCRAKKCDTSLES